MKGAIILPAHDEASVIADALAPLAELAVCPSIDVVVAANGCRDRTVDVARAVPGVRVLDLPEASKAGALNAADELTDRFPRIYLDADVVAPTESVVAVLRTLERGPALAARPPFVYDTTGASAPVRAYYRARTRLPGNSRSLWGAGFYALSREGRARFTRFPDLLGDDVFVDACFDDSEKEVVMTAPVVVRTPRTSSALHRVLRRTYAGNAQLADHLRVARAPAPPRSGNLRELARTSATSWSASRDAAVYTAFAVAGHWIPTTGGSTWQRDDSSRSGEVHG